MAAFGTSRWVRESSAPELGDDETVIKHGPANHFMGIEGVGGWLYLTASRLVFKSHALNIQTHELALPLSDIRTVEPVRTMGIVPNGLKVTAGEAKPERFVVHGRKEWVRAIEDARRQAADICPEEAERVAK